jgi:hypothetical protein
MPREGLLFKFISECTMYHTSMHLLRIEMMLLLR